MANLWEVIGGAGKGGILVREGRELASAKLEERLSSGALVEEVTLDVERLQYQLISGIGPVQGWVSIKAGGRELMRRTTQPVKQEGTPHTRPTVLEDELRAACREAGIEPLPTATEADLRVALAELGVSLDGQASAGCVAVDFTLGADAAVGVTQNKEETQLLSVVQHATGKENGESRGSEDTGDNERAAWIAEVQMFDASKDDPYQIFGVPYDATDAAIKSAFRKMSLKVHPDRCPGDSAAAAKFQQLTLAKEFLLDPYRRRAFNQAHGFLTPTVNVAWWVDWDDIFAEIEPDAETEVPTPAPSIPGSIANKSRIDVLIFGATGLTGTLACMVMQRCGGLGHTWAIAGRDGRKLQLLQHKFGQGPSFQRAFRVGNRRDIEQAVQASRIVLDCTGPSHDTGVVVAEACIRAGTHLIDNSGDIMFSKEVKDKLDNRAKAAKVCLLIHVGYVSVPTDFGVWRLVRNVREKLGLPTRKVDVYTYTQGFVMSGTSLLTGTANTMKGLKEAGGPFILGGVRPGGLRKEDYTAGPHKDENSSMIAYPGLNIERLVVRGTCGLMDHIEPYGERFNFKDWFLVVDKKPDEMSKQESEQAMRLRGIGASLGGSQPLMVEQKLIPPPGWGPKERIRQETFVTKVFVAAADDGKEQSGTSRKVHCVMNAGPGGVGDRYEGTAAMMIEAASCMLDAVDSGKARLRSGWGTPVYHLAHLGFFERLESLGFSYSFFDGAPTSDFMHRVFAATLPIGM